MRKCIAVLALLLFASPAYAGSLAQVLAWKHNGAPGVRTHENVQTGKMEIFDWPTAELGPEPTPAQIATWTAEFDALPPTPDPDDVLDDAIGRAANLQELKDALLGKVKPRGRR